MGLARVIISMVKSFTGMFPMVELYEVKELDVPDVDKIIISTTSTSVNLLPSDQEKITVELKGQVNKKLSDTIFLDVRLENNSAKINVARKSHSFIFGFFMDRSKVNVYFPQKWYKKIDVNTKSGCIEGKRLTADILSLKTSSGSIRVNKAEANSECSFKASSGSVHVNDLRSSSDISVQTFSGGIRASHIQSGSKLEMKARSGGLDVQELTAKNLSLSTSSGSIKIRDVHGALKAETSSGSIKAMNDHIEGEWKLRTSSGSVSVQLDHPESLLVQFKGNSGSSNISLEEMECQSKTKNSFIGKIGAGENKLTVRTNSGSFRLN